MSEKAFWHVPLLVLAGLFAIAGIGVSIAVWKQALPDPIGSSVQWALGGAAAMFTLARILHAKHVGRRELELLLVIAGIFLAEFLVMIAGAIIILGVIVLVLDEIS